MKSNRPKIGICRCLLGQKVRYDGGQKGDRYLTGVLGRCVEWVGVCPEVECGFSVPREAMRLVDDADGLLLMTQRTHIDVTEKMNRWLGPALTRLAGENLSGFIFKARSPSCAIRDAAIHSEAGTSKHGPGLFGRAFIRQFPQIPVEDEERLSDPALRENFIERIFVFQRFLKMT